MDVKVEDSSDVSDERSEICRLCGQESIYYVPIFGENNHCIPEKISRCLPIIIFPTDKLPSNICKRCLHYLNISYRLILTSVEVDNHLRTQLEETQKCGVSPSTLCKTNQISDPTSIGLMSLRELKKRAITGPAECDLCHYKFQDIDMFDTHMEQFHLLKWRCSLCDSSFRESNELIKHKILRHSGNIIICNRCKCTNNQNNGQTITDEHHIGQKEAVFTTAVEVNKEVTASSVDLEMQIEGNTVKRKSESSEQVSMEQSESSDSETDAIIKKCNEILKKLNVLKEKKEQLFCDFCKIRFGEERYYNAHNKIHEEKRTTCTMCRMEYPSVYELFLHKREAHNMYKKVQLKYVCNKCGKFFTNSWHWETHKEDECSKMANRFCKYCSTVFPTQLKLMRHLRKHKLEMLSDPTATIYKCIACPKVFVDKEFYEKHRNVHDPACWDKFKCTLCNRPFRDKFRLREHQLATHEGTKPHQCDICERKFLRLHNMKMHRKIHFGRKCNHCDAIFKRISELIKHVQEVHDLEPDMQKSFNRQYRGDSYICRYCGKKLSTYQSLLSHERIHTGEKPYGCPICHRTFRSYTSRWTHVQRHQKGNFVCEHCGKCFSYKQNLIAHIDTHLPMEDRKYQCNVCGKRFMRKPHLTIHKRIHDGVRPFTCDICDLSFTQKGDLNRHRMRHFKEDTQSAQQKSSMHVEQEELDT